LLDTGRGADRRLAAARRTLRLLTERAELGRELGNSRFERDAPLDLRGERTLERCETGVGPRAATCA
jgi:hypothetical protein